MGIVNLTDDSFSGDGLSNDARRAIDHGLRLVEQGAHLLDLGAESSRPGAPAVPTRQELARVLPVMAGLRECGVPLSIDTCKPDVMREVIAAGADMINDIRALQAPGALDAVAASKTGVCLMHMQGDPLSMQAAPQYCDVMKEVLDFLTVRSRVAEAAGIAAERIAVDPGFGFGKSAEHNLTLLRKLGELRAIGRPLLVGLSRKSMLGLLIGRTADERVHASVAAALLALQRGAAIVRVHDVAATRDALAIWNAVEEY